MTVLRAPEGGATVLGADGCPTGGWIVAELPAAGPVRWHHVTGMRALLDLLDVLGAQALAVDVPIGLPESGLRACDVQARARLGARRSSVFAAPHRVVLGPSTYAEARELQPSLSAQAFGLMARIRDVDTVLRDAGTGVHRHVVECHPEVSLQALTGQVLARKKSAPGALQRLAALTAELGALPTDASPAAALDDALDAAACAWTARRWLAGDAEVLGEEVDATGVPMRIVV